ncbi:MAG: radical SAM protein [Dongiaceae bacterium]
MLPAPRFLFVTVNQRCNLRCQHCYFWQRDDDDRPNYMSQPHLHEVIGEFAEMSPGGNIVICGGEPMLDLEIYFGIAGTCRRLGLNAISVVNGTRIRSDSMAERMVREGPHEISISLNSQRADLHDETRGIPGAFDKAVQALRLLLAARRRLRSNDTRIYVMGLIFDRNYREIDAFYDFVINDIGADKLKLNFLQPAFGQADEIDPFFADHHGVDPDEIGAIIARCDDKYALGLNPEWLHQVKMYFRSLGTVQDIARGWGSDGRTEEHICNTYDRNIMVNEYGMARLCFSTGFPGIQLREPGDLRHFWYGAEPIRAAMRQCNRFCGISHSVRRATSSTASIGKTLPVA